jgi:hypothetical protein
MENELKIQKLKFKIQYEKQTPVFCGPTSHQRYHSPLLLFSLYPVLLLSPTDRSGNFLFPDVFAKLVLCSIHTRIFCRKNWKMPFR